MTQPDVSIGLEIRGEVEVEYGPLRCTVAQWAGKSPAEVTGDDVARYEAEQEEGQL